MPSLLVSALDAVYGKFLQPPGAPAFDFAGPPGEGALYSPDSVTWRVCKNPLTLLIGGIAAVVLELAEPRVCSGVWLHTSFPRAPVARLRRTGLATLVTVYGARRGAERMISAVRRKHAAVRGRTADGLPYDANDPELLDWVQATAAAGFRDASHRWLRPLEGPQRDAFLSEGSTSAALYGAVGAPRSEAEWLALLDRTLPRLRPSPVIDEFIRIVRCAPLLPRPLRPVQRMLIHAALDTVPAVVRRRIGLDVPALPTGTSRTVRTLARWTDALVLPSSPPVQSCLRLGLPEHYLFPTQAQRRGRTASVPG